MDIQTCLKNTLFSFSHHASRATVPHLPGATLASISSLGIFYDRVSIGDVGYVSEGAFICMSDVRLPWDDESNRTFDIPNCDDPLGFGHLSTIRRETFDEVDHYFHCISRDENANYVQAASPEQ